MWNALRGPLAILAVFALAVAVAWYTFRPPEVPQPTGSSNSYEPDGTQALYQWLEALGMRTTRLDQPTISTSAPPRMLFVIEPEQAIAEATTRAEFDTVAEAGGTLVVAGDSLSTRDYLADLGVTVELVPTVDAATVVESNAILALSARARVRAAGAEPLLVAPTGDWLALRMPYRAGTLVAFATAAPLTNEALRQPETAAFVYETLAEPLGPGAQVAFDEVHYAASTVETVQPPSFNRLLADTPLGRAVLYAAVATFLYLWLANRRLGPPLPAASAAALARTMLEHVEALAGLYRRGKHVETAGRHFAQHYRRGLAHSLGVDPSHLHTAEEMRAALKTHAVSESTADVLARAFATFDLARSETDLARGIAQAESALESLPRYRRGDTLTTGRIHP